jgi:hypothetical protein
LIDEGGYVIYDGQLTGHRGLMTGLISAPFVINNFVSAELVQRILPDW